MIMPKIVFVFSKRRKWPYQMFYRDDDNEVTHQSSTISTTPLIRITITNHRWTPKFTIIIKKSLDHLLRKAFLGRPGNPTQLSWRGGSRAWIRYFEIHNLVKDITLWCPRRKNSSLSGLPYRVRLLGADQCPDCLMILLDDLERSFEGEEDTLTTSCLKLCLTSSPARWLKKQAQMCK